MSDLPTVLHTSLIGHSGAVNSVKWTLDGAYCLSCSQDKTIRLWNPLRESVNDTKGVLNIMTFSNVHTKPVYDISAFKDNSKFWSGGGEGKLFLWNVEICRSEIG